MLAQVAGSLLVYLAEGTWVSTLSMQIEPQAPCDKLAISGQSAAPKPEPSEAASGKRRFT
jgi:hypothetical protein